ncbi:hypothetical protein TNCV_2542601 [Trichonephila clavipes]|nr:hypothetical protein TNCV_2542601 [Trichonephila clavipes]
MDECRRRNHPLPSSACQAACRQSTESVCSQYSSNTNSLRWPHREKIPSVRNLVIVVAIEPCRDPEVAGVRGFEEETYMK